MAVTINYNTYVISVPKSDTQFVETNINTGLEIREINIDTFGRSLSDVQDDPGGVWAATAYSYTPPATIGGIQLAPVLLILSPYTVTFEDGQYAVNLVGGNTNLQDFTNVNQVSIRPNNSAGQTFSKQVEDSAFGDNRVWIDTGSDGTPGVIYPNGTTSKPVNNLDDALLIIAARNLPKRLHLSGSITTDASDNLSGYNILGSSARLASLEVTTGTDTTNLIISNLSMTGDLNGNITANGTTSFDNIIDFDGRMIHCGIKGTIDLGSPAEDHEFIDCFSEVSGNSKPVIDCDNLVNASIQFRRYSGGLKIINFVNGGSLMSIDINQGAIEIDSSCTGGLIVIRGTGTPIIDNSGVGCTVISDGFNHAISEIDLSSIADKVWSKTLP